MRLENIEGHSGTSPESQILGVICRGPGLISNAVLLVRVHAVSAPCDPVPDDLMPPEEVIHLEGALVSRGSILPLPRVTSHPEQPRLVSANVRRS